MGSGSVCCGGGKLGRPAATTWRRLDRADRGLQLPVTSARRPAGTAALSRPGHHDRAAATSSRQAARACRLRSTRCLIPLQSDTSRRTPMPRGRQPVGDHALSDAERQARYRPRRQAERASPLIRYRRPADRRTRPQRWHDAVAELLALQAEYAAWCDALPNSLRDSATAEALQAHRRTQILMSSLTSSRRVALDAIDA